MEKRLRIRQTRPDGRPVKWDFLTEWEMDPYVDERIVTCQSCLAD
jgi:hypothetical protein